jgi:hypothetical protein
MHLDEARHGARFSVFFATAATLLGVFGVISVARADSASMTTTAISPVAVQVRQGVTTERLRDCVTFTRHVADAAAIVASSR